MNKQEEKMANQQNQNTGQQAGSGKGKKQAKKENFEVQLVGTKNFKKSFRLYFDVILKGKDGVPKGLQSFKVMHLGKEICQCQTDENGYYFLTELFSYEEASKAVKLTFIGLDGFHATRTINFPLPEVKQEKKEEVTDINLLLVDTEDCGDDYKFTFRAFTATGKKPIGNVSFKVYHKKDLKRTPTTEKNGEKEFQVEIEKSKLDKKLVIVVKTDGLAGRTFTFDLPEEKKRVIEKTNILSITNGESVYDLKKVTIPIHIDTPFTGYEANDYQIIIMDSEMKRLSGTPIHASSDGHHTYELEIPINKIQEILEYKDGKKKLIIELISKTGKEGDTKEHRSKQDHEVPVHLPAGTFADAIAAFIIRQNKHLADLIKACLFTWVMIISVNYAGKGHFGVIFAVFCSVIAWYTYAKSKSVIRKTVTFFWTGLVLVLAIISFDGVEALLTKGIAAAFAIGVPCYVAEELWRKPDGKQAVNIYPWIPGFILLGMALWQVLALPFEIIPDWTETSQSTKHWNEAMQSTKQMFLYLVASSALLSYGGSREIADWAKSATSSVAATKLSGSAGMMNILQGLFSVVRNFFVPGKRR